jgi:tetratricopeptide (TPR) repeat protein
VPTADRRSWWIAGGAVLGALVFLLLPYVWTGWADQGDAPRVPMGGTANVPAPGPAPGVDLSTMTPREAAERLFNRVMAALSEGNQAEVESFLPMAIDAYGLVPDLDADGHFHLSLLQQAAGDYGPALETAERVLQDDPDHLLARYAAAEAARELGRDQEARAHFAHVLEVFDAEVERGLPEYQEHSGFLPTIRETAERFLTTGGG